LNPPCQGYVASGLAIASWLAEESFWGQRVGFGHAPFECVALGPTGLKGQPYLIFSMGSFI